MLSLTVSFSDLQVFFFFFFFDLDTGIMLPTNGTVVVSRVSSCVDTANTGLNEGSVRERLFSAPARKDIVLDPLVCKFLLWTENQM